MSSPERKSTVIDAHHHFWVYSAREYDWIDDQMAALRRDFLPPDLEAETRCAGVDAVISVQARQSLEETRWLLGLADRHRFIAGVVGWIPLVSPAARQTLEQLTAHRKLKGVRHVLQAEPDPDHMLRADFNTGVRLLKDYDLAYDILIFERQLAQTVQFVDLHPQQVFVVDHLAKPRIRLAEFEPWRTRLLELGRREHVFCKLSGLVTEADYRSWTVAQLLPYITTALEAFGPARVMFGSDWPVCLVAVAYQRWAQIVRDLVAKLTVSEQAAVLGTTARRVYRLEATVGAGE
jgi:L-fuconolactonase